MLLNTLYCFCSLVCVCFNHVCLLDNLHTYEESTCPKTLKCKELVLAGRVLSLPCTTPMHAEFEHQLRRADRREGHALLGVLVGGGERAGCAARREQRQRGAAGAERRGAALPLLFAAACVSFISVPLLLACA